MAELLARILFPSLLTCIILLHMERFVTGQRACSTNSPTGNLVFRISETEGDVIPNLILDMSRDIMGSAEQISLGLVGNPGNYFQLRGKQLFLQKPIDRDASNTNTINLIITCNHVEGNQLLQHEIDVIVIIEDINDNAPQFINGPYAVEMPALTPVNSVILSGIQAVDADSGENSRIIYSIADDAGTPRNISEYFGLEDPTKGTIYLKKTLDFETPQQFQLIVVAEDSARDRAKRQSGSATVNVNVQGQNDSPPLFVHPNCAGGRRRCTGSVVYTANIRAGQVATNVPISVRPNQISAFDSDSLNLPVTYTFVNGTPDSYSAYFFLDQVSGALFQQQPVPFGIDQFDIYFAAQEVGAQGLYSMARLQISVDNRASNQYAPVLQVSSLEGYIAENADVGTTVRISPNPDAESLQILVTDEDLRPGMPPATYQYILTGLGASVFAVNQGGYVALNEPNLDTDFPNPSAYQLTVQAREVGTQPIRSSRPVTITINAIDVNDNPPRFDKQVYTAEVAPTGGLRDVIQVKATDSDSGPFGELRYRIVSVTNGGESLFRYNRDTNNLVVLGPLIPGEQYQVLLEALDGGGRTAQAVVLVTVAQDQRQPSIRTQTPPPPRGPNQVYEYRATVSEATPPNTVVMALNSENRPSKLRYAIISGNNEGRFRIDPVSGTISTVQPFDRETTPGYRLVVQASLPNGALANTTVISVDVSDENDNVPRFAAPQPITFQIPVGSENDFVGRIQAQDADAGANGNVKLFLEEQSPYFTLSEDGSLRTASALPAEQRSYRLNVIAQDSGVPPRQSTATVIVNLIPAQQQQIQTGQTSQTGQRGQTGQARPDAAIAALPPVFSVTDYQVEISENEKPTDLVRLQAISPSGGSVTYILKQGDPTLFSVDETTGTLRTMSNLDAEKTQSHRVVVSTREAALMNSTVPRNSATIIISVLDENDWRPNFQPRDYSTDLVDNVEPGTPLVQLTAVDQDAQPPNNQFEYRLTGNTDAQPYFQINPTSGLLTVAKNLQPIQESSFVLQVEARDKGTPPRSSTAAVAISIQARATTQASFTPGPPGETRFTMSSYSASVSESVIPPHFVQILPTVNKPANPRSVECIIISGNHGGMFSISAGEEGNCELRTRGSLDRETVPRYLLNVSVSAPSPRGGRATDFARISVTVLDTNDNGPRFTYNYEYMGLKTYFGAISSDAPPLTQILTVSAVDPDMGNNSVVRYQLDAEDSDQQYFQIALVTGDVRNSVSMGGLVGRDPPYFNFNVEATDSPIDGRSLTSKAEIVINIITNGNRFIMTAEGILPDQIERYTTDMTRIFQAKTTPCTVLGVEKMMESSELAGQGIPGTDIWWYAIDPRTKTICTRDDFGGLFTDDSVRHLRGQMTGWFRLRSVKEAVPSRSILSGGFGTDWEAAPIALIVLGIVILIGSLLAIVAMCYFWTRYKASRTVVGTRPQLYGALPKYNALILPPSEKEYETQMLEMAVAEDELGNGKPLGMMRYPDSDYIMDDGIYTIQPSGRFEPVHHRHQAPALIIPPPDYPMNGSGRNQQRNYTAGDKKTML